MGGARFSQTDWNVHATKTRSMPQDQIFTQRGACHDDLNPAKIKFREARDSEANPESTPIILCSDVTGSMGILAEQIVKHDLGEIMLALYEKRPITDPAIMSMAVGDANGDQAPLQVTQFESAVEPAVEQLKKIWIEQNGGGNGGETYSLAWLFAGAKTKCDALKKRKKKGYLFTIGDECCHPVLKRDHIRQFLDLPAEADMDVETLLRQTEKDWHVFHLIVKPESSQPVLSSWRALLGERAIQVHDLKHMAAGIVSTIQVIEGQNVDDIVKSWDGSTAVQVVRQVTAQLVKA